MKKAPGEWGKRIELSVRLSDGSFDSSVDLPVDASAAAKDAVVRQWFGLMQAALAVVKESRHAD